MARGGRRPGAGRKKIKPEAAANKNLATRILNLAQKPIHAKDCRCEECWWWDKLNCGDQRVELEAGKYLTDKRDGKPVQTVNHVHDKPIEMNVNISLAETIQKARARAGQ